MPQKPRSPSLILAIILYLPATLLQAGTTDFDGDWIVNAELSGDTDREVEKAIREAGGFPSGGKRGGKERYRGGPADQLLYDHISYDQRLHFEYREPRVRLVYDDGFERSFYADGRGRVASASGTAGGDRSDYSFASWEGERLLVESRPLDGGNISEIFTLEEGGQRLRVELELHPLSFRWPILLVRVYDRVSTTP